MDGGGENYLLRSLTRPVQLCCTIQGFTITFTTKTTWSQSDGAAYYQITVIFTTKLDQLTDVGDTSFHGLVSKNNRYLHSLAVVS